MAFRDEFDGFEEAGPKTNGSGAEQAGKAPPPPWRENITPIIWAEMLGRSAPPRRFVAKGWIPYGCVTSLYGAGGIGKSLLAQLLATAVATNQRWLGIETEQCRVLALFCEDDSDELWRRQERINITLGITMADIRDFMPDARTGKENVLAHGRDVLLTTELYDQIAAAIAELKPGLVILDNIAQMFSGTENDRAHVTQFVNFATSLAQDGDCAVLLLGHVAKAEGSEYSGSTAWNAAVRSRMLLANEGQGEDKRLLLSQPKANYSERGSSIELEWRDGMIHAINQFDDGPSGHLERGLRDGQANQVFLNALDTLRVRGMAASEHSKAAQTYAPKLIIAQGLAGEFSKQDMQAAMERLFKEGRIRANMPVTKGSSRHQRYGIGRPEWEWPVPDTGGHEKDSGPAPDIEGHEKMCDAQAPDGGCAAHSVPIAGTHCAPHPDSSAALHIVEKNMSSACAAQMCSAPDEADEVDL